MRQFFLRVPRGARFTAIKGVSVSSVPAAPYKVSPAMSWKMPSAMLRHQVSRHLDQVTKSRSALVSEKRNKNRRHKIDWP